MQCSDNDLIKLDSVLPTELEATEMLAHTHIYFSIRIINSFRNSSLGMALQMKLKVNFLIYKLFLILNSAEGIGQALKMHCFGKFVWGGHNNYGSRGIWGRRGTAEVAARPKKCKLNGGRGGDQIFKII